jgi:hypothetical protein
MVAAIRTGQQFQFQVTQLQQLNRDQLSSSRSFARTVTARDHEPKMATADQKLSHALQLLQTVTIESQQWQNQFERFKSQTLSLAVHNSDLISRFHASELLHSEQVSSFNSQVSQLQQLNRDQLSSSRSLAGTVTAREFSLLHPVVMVDFGISTDFVQHIHASTWLDNYLGSNNTNCAHLYDPSETS